MADIIMPSLGENVKEGSVVNVLVKPGDAIEKGQTLIEVETDKVTFEVPAEVSGQLIEIFVKIGDTIQSGYLLGKVSGEVSIEIEKNIPEKVIQFPSSKDLHHQFVDSKLPSQSTEYSDKKNGSSTSKENKTFLSTPLARKLARELDIEISEIATAINKRITFNDVKVFTKERIRQLTNRKRQDQSISNTPSLPDFEKFGTVRR